MDERGATEARFQAQMLFAGFKARFLGWPEWWADLSTFEKIFPAASILAYWLLLLAIGGFRGDHVGIGLAILALSYGGRSARGALIFLLPFFLTAIIYDSQRFYSDFIRGTIRVREPYEFDKRFFGIEMPGHGRLTPNEWWQLHLHPALDLLCGFAYLVFILTYMGVTVYFWKFGPEKWRPHAHRMTWAFLLVNVIGYSTYYWYPAAPPWYVTLYGLGPADLSARPNPAGCLRFDQLLGTHFFTEMYGRSADVFGAIPSLHIAYPLQAVYFSFRFGSARVFSIGFYLIMCLSAVYLNHHYVLDILWGSVYAIAFAWCVDVWFERRHQRANGGLAS